MTDNDSDLQSTPNDVPHLVGGEGELVGGGDRVRHDALLGGDAAHDGHFDRYLPDTRKHNPFDYGDGLDQGQTIAQQIRVRALDVACQVADFAVPDAMHSNTDAAADAIVDAVLAIADRFAAYITTGETLTSRLSIEEGKQS